MHVPNKKTPLGRGHILVQYEPFKQEDAIPYFDFLHKTGKREFYQDGERIVLDNEHYFPTFIAKRHEELRDDPNGEHPLARKTLKQFNIFGEAGAEDEAEPVVAAEKSQTSGDISKKSTQNLDKKSEEKKSIDDKSTKSEHSKKEKSEKQKTATTQPIFKVTDGRGGHATGDGLN